MSAPPLEEVTVTDASADAFDAADCSTTTGRTTSATGAGCGLAGAGAGAGAGECAIASACELSVNTLKLTPLLIVMSFPLSSSTAGAAGQNATATPAVMIPVRI